MKQNTLILKLLPLLLFSVLPSIAQTLDYTFTTNNEAITITGYSGTGGAIIIPDSINSFPVKHIGGSAFYDEASLTSVVIPNSVTSIGSGAFWNCSDLTDIIISQNVRSIGGNAFKNCGLTSIVIPNNVTSIGGSAFAYCNSLTNVVIGNSVTFIGGNAFSRCSMTSITVPESVVTLEWEAFASIYNLTSVYFKGNAPNTNSDNVFGRDTPIVYYLLGTTGWGPTFSGCPTVLKPLRMELNSEIALQTNQFGFDINWFAGDIVIIDYSEHLAPHYWIPLSTNTIPTNGTLYYSDSGATNHYSRFYRVRAP